MPANPSQPQAPCPATTRAGQPCQAPTTGSGWCYTHDPDRADERAERNAKGGRNRSTVARLERRMPATLGRTVELLSDALEQTHAGSMSAARGQAVAAIGRALAAVYSEHEVEQRIADVEQSLAMLRRTGLRVVP